MTIKINFEYKLKDKIRINDINTKGIIVGHYNGESGVQYQVAYFLDGTRKTIYLYPEEISKTDGTEDLGFNIKLL